MDSPLVSVVITNFNRCDDLRDALLSVKKQDYPHLEIIVVDNASEDESRAMLAREFPEVCSIPLEENIGMDGYSVGFRQAQGELIFQMDNDSVLPDAHVISTIVKRFSEGPTDLAAVATRVEETRQTTYSVEALRDQDKRQGPINAGGFHSGGVGFKKSLVDQVGDYNKDVFLYGSEVFLQMKLLAKGYKIIFYPEILVLHKSSRVARSATGVFYELRNRYWMARYLFSGVRRWSLIIQMMLHDVGYSLRKGTLRTLWHAWVKGLGTLPASLDERLVSNEIDFKAKLQELYRTFNLPATLGRSYRTIKGG